MNAESATQFTHIVKTFKLYSTTRLLMLEKSPQRKVNQVRPWQKCISWHVSDVNFP